MNEGEMNFKEIPMNRDASGSSETEDVATHPDYDRIAKKLSAVRRSTTEKHGSPNVYLAAKLLYVSLYDQQEAVKIIPMPEQFPDREEIIRSKLSNVPSHVPTEEEFVSKIRDAMVRETDFSKGLTEETRDQFHRLLTSCEHTVIWTDGDGVGFPDKNLPGSKEQLRKIAANPFNAMRGEIAKERGVDRGEVMSIVAQEGKMDFIPKMIAYFESRGIKTVILIEDRKKNIEQFLGIVAERDTDIDIVPILVHKGRHGANIKQDVEAFERARGELNGIDDMSELMAKLSELRTFSEGKKVGAVVDMDGVLLDDDIRIKNQTDAVVKTLIANGWI